MRYSRSKVSIQSSMIYWAEVLNFAKATLLITKIAKYLQISTWWPKIVHSLCLTSSLVQNNFRDFKTFQNFHNFHHSQNFYGSRNFHNFLDFRNFHNLRCDSCKEHTKIHCSMKFLSQKSTTRKSSIFHAFIPTYTSGINFSSY